MSTTTIQVHQLRCLWRGVFGARPVRVLVLTESRKPDLALVTTDLTTPAARIVERYASRWGEDGRAGVERAGYPATRGSVATGLGDAADAADGQVEQ
jgi:hypothetical protein